MANKKEIQHQDDDIDDGLTRQEARFLNDVGKALRQARLDKKLSLEDISHKLRIRKAYLKAIESGSIESLPQLSFSTGFVKSYSTYLGLNAAEVVRTFRSGYLQNLDRVEPKTNTSNLIQPPAPPTKIKLKMDYIWGGILVCIALVLIWAFFQPKTASNLYDQFVDDTVANTMIEGSHFGDGDEGEVKAPLGASNFLSLDSDSTSLERPEGILE